MDRSKMEINAGQPGYLNKNCFLVKNLNYGPYDRCRYCDSKFRHCLFLQYQVISLFLIIILLGLFFIVENRISALAVITVFTLVIVYGYFLNNSTEKIIRSNFEEKKAKNELKKVNENLEEKVAGQTKDIIEKNKKLERLLKVKSEFLDIASHQLRTPVSVICGILDMFKSGTMDKLPKQKQLDFISNAFSKGRKLNAIIDDILDASDLDENELDLKNSLEKVDFTKLVKDIVNYNLPEAEKKNINFALNLTSDIIVNGDKKYLEQAIGNLIDNAIKYTPSGKLISVKLARKDNIAELQVKDSGIGIPEKEKNSLFHKFIRASNAREMHTDGSGLGLFIVKKIIDAHSGGKIWFESKEDVGTTFFVQLTAI